MKWIIAKHEPPEDKRNNDGSPKQLFIETLHESGNITRGVMTANQLADYVKNNYRKKIQWLDESSSPSDAEQGELARDIVIGIKGLGIVGSAVEWVKKNYTLIKKPNT